MRGGVGGGSLGEGVVRGSGGGRGRDEGVAMAQSWRGCRGLAAMLLLAAGAACLAGAPEPVGPELLANGSFEAVEKERNLPVGWLGFSTRDWGDCAGTLAVSSRTPREGKRCVELSAVRTQYALTPATRVTVAAGRAYLLTAWVRTELARGEAAFVAASWSSDERWLSLDRSRALRGRQPWTQVQLLLRPEARPAEATRLQVSFRVTGERERGRAWVDAVSLRACRVPPPRRWPSSSVGGSSTWRESCSSSGPCGPSASRSSVAAAPTSSASSPRRAASMISSAVTAAPAASARS